ncbi:Cacna1b, partial [Symbiodinium sp. CCMP2456]
MGLGGAAGPQFSIRPLLCTWAAGEWLAWVVVTNSIFIGVEAIQWAYTGMFTLELILRICGNGKSFFCCEDWVWNYLDIFVVPLRLQSGAMVWGGLGQGVESRCKTPKPKITTTKTDTQTPISARMPRPLTFQGLTSVWEKVADIILRTGVVRLARVLRFVMALRTLISSIIYTLKSLVWAMILLCLIVYVFAVLFTQAAGDFLLLDGATLLEPPLEMSTSKTRFFGSLQTSMLALFMSIAGGVSWVEVVGELQLLSTGWVFVFIFYIAFTYFAVLNVVTGVFCQSAIDSAQNDQTLVLQAIQAEKQANIEKITNLFKAIDIEETGVITYKMLEDQVNSPEVQTYFEAIGLDVWD